MLLFLVGLALLAIGYFTYGRFVDRLLAPDGRATPAVTRCDGVDFVTLPHWRNMLIQLLNIAGIGPVIGVILGVKFGAIVFLIIPVGNVIGGAVHDFVAGMISLRSGGMNLPGIVEMNLGKTFSRVFSVFMTFLLLLVVAVFINVPAKLVTTIPGAENVFWVAVAVIFIYYIAATLFPVDKIIGTLYPWFGGLLVVGTMAIFVMLLIAGVRNPELLCESAAFRKGMMTAPVIPVLFVTIACGIISGFHATQSPIVARTMIHEKQARSTYYGMMILEGVIAMIWAAAGMAVYNLFPELMARNPMLVLSRITTHFLGGGMGMVTVLGVIVLAVTSGDTAMRSLRLSLAELFGIDQKPLGRRIALCVPLIVCVALLLWWSNRSAKSFGFLWNYFAWGNQVLAASTLMAATVWMMRLKRPAWVTLLPGMFMTFIVLSYILWTSPAHGGPAGFGLELPVAYGIAGVTTLILGAWVAALGNRRQ